MTCEGVDRERLTPCCFFLSPLAGKISFSLQPSQSIGVACGVKRTWCCLLPPRECDADMIRTLAPFLRLRAGAAVPLFFFFFCHRARA